MTAVAAFYFSQIKKKYSDYREVTLFQLLTGIWCQRDGPKEKLEF